MNRGSHRGGDDSSTIALLFGNGWPRSRARQAGVPQERVGQLQWQEGEPGSLQVAGTGECQPVGRADRRWRRRQQPDPRPCSRHEPTPSPMPTTARGRRAGTCGPGRHGSVHGTGTVRRGVCVQGGHHRRGGRLGGRDGAAGGPGGRRRQAVRPQPGPDPAEAASDAGDAQATFDAIQPPDRRAEVLRGQLDRLLTLAASVLADLRIAARWGDTAALPRLAAPLPKLAEKLQRFEEAHQ
jgi:hypothetical protein